MLRNEIPQPCFFQFSMPVYTWTQATRHCHATALPAAQRGLFFFREPCDYKSLICHEVMSEKMERKMSNCGSVRFVLLILLFSITLSKGDNFDKRKNVLVMIGDDVGFQTQVYNNTVCKTPNLNALAKRSVTFRNGFTSVSSCSPSRSAILTGKKVRSANDIKVRKCLQWLCMPNIRHEGNSCGDILK